MKIVIEIDVNEYHDGDDTWIEGGEVRVRGDGVTQQQLDSLAERWAQSDWFWVDFPGLIVTKMGETS